MKTPWFTPCLLILSAIMAGPAAGQGVAASMSLRSDDHVILSWESIPGGIYHIEESGGPFGTADLATWQFRNLSFPPFGATGTVSSIDLGVKNEEAPVFYRIHSFEPPAGCLFYESFEGGGSGWSAVTAMGSTQWDTGMWNPDCPVSYGPEMPYSGLFAAGTDVFGPYSAGVAARYESPVIDLTGQTSASVTFREWYDLEQDADFGSLTVIENTGQVLLSGIHVVTGSSGGWVQTPEIMLPANAMGKLIKLRFNLLTDLDQATDLGGWYLDEVCVMPGP